MNKKETKRLQLEMTAESIKQLEALKVNSGSPTYAEVCRKALRLYDTLIGYEKEGNKIIVRDKNGDDMLFPLTLL